MSNDDDGNPLKALFHKVRLQWDVKLPDRAPGVAIEGNDDNGDRGNNNNNIGKDRSNGTDCFALLQHSMGSNLRILSNGGDGREG